MFPNHVQTLECLASHYVDAEMCSCFFFILQVLERAPAAPSGSNHVLFEQFWLEKGPGPAPEAATTDGDAHKSYTSKH